ncbi:Oxidoreductase [Elasticomyces elasticus]|nr:Oxidoreductase [Elasticomyces elasticus]
MFRSASRTLLRNSAPRFFPRSSTQRFLTTAPPHQTSRSWKSSAARWGLAIGLVYYYNTSTAFAEAPTYTVEAPPEADHESETLPTLDAIALQRQQRKQSEVVAARPTPAPSVAVGTQSTPVDAAAPGSPEELEEEANQQGAFNEETGEINWDCPCLGGMAHGPCGEEFRAAFSCFVYSKEEPKGMDCIDRFKGMQNCFRQHPDIYGSELDEDEEPEADVLAGENASPASVEPSEPSNSAPPSLANIESPHGKGEKVSENKPHHEPDPAPMVQERQDRARAATQQVQQDHAPQSESDGMVPKAWHDSRSDNDGK